MSGLSLEVMFTILEEVEVGRLFALSLVDRELRKACQSKILWKRIFRKHNLVMLKKNKSTCSWITNFNRSLENKKVIDQVMERINNAYDVEAIIEPFNLGNIRDVSTIHVPKVTKKSELETFLCIHELYKQTSCTYLYLEKKKNVYYMTIMKHDDLHSVAYKLDTKQISLLLYKLLYVKDLYPNWFLV